MTQCKKDGGDGIDTPEFQQLLDKLALIQRLVEAYPQAWYQEFPTREAQREFDRFEKMQLTCKALSEDFAKHRRMFVQAVESNYKAAQLLAVSRVMETINETATDYNTNKPDLTNITPISKKPRINN